MSTSDLPYKVFSTGVAIVCGYETVAIVSRRVPTVSALCARHPALIPFILGGLAVHLETIGTIAKSWQKRRSAI